MAERHTNYALSRWFVKRIASESVEVMSASAVVPEVVHDGSVERIVDPEEVSSAAITRVSSTCRMRL